MAQKHKSRSLIASGLRTSITAPLALAGGWVVYSNVAINHDMWLPKALDAERKVFTSQAAGNLSYYYSSQGTGRPLVLIHSINAAASSYEMRPLFEHYRATRPVYALDLPGFGFSERANRIYTPQLYQDAILDFLASEVDQVSDVVALSLGAEFAARAATVQPARFHSLALISPSGFSASPQANQTGANDTLYQALSFPLWARPFYDLLVTRPSIKYFLSLSFQGPVDKGLMEYDYITSHQPGAEFAPLYFVGGKLFTPDVCTRFYTHVTSPVLVLYDRDAFVGFSALPDFVAQHDNWRAVRIYPTTGLPQFEKLDETVAALDRFWNA